MIPRQLFLHALTVMTVISLLPIAAWSDDFFGDGTDSFDWVDTREPWIEQGVRLPVYPSNLDELIQLNVVTQSLPYRVYIDPASLTTGKDQVVRFTSVLVSSSGVWNVTYEGLHCGERTYRRYAYGSDGVWHSLKQSTWTRVSGGGINQYRKLLYDDYLCEVATPYLSRDELLYKLR